jgi:hypothetical protein
VLLKVDNIRAKTRILCVLGAKTQKELTSYENTRPHFFFFFETKQILLLVLLDKCPRARTSQCAEVQNTLRTKSDKTDLVLPTNIQIL